MRDVEMTHLIPQNRYALRVVLAASISFAALGFAATPAQADRRKPAPIVYAGQGTSASSSDRTRSRRATTPRRASRQSRSTPRPTSAPTAAATSGTRVEFRYPDQPDRFYGAGGTRSAADAPPLSFSSSETAISEAAARQYSNAAPEPLPQSAPAVARDPAITAGGFDARAAAARNARPATPAPVQSVAAPAREAAPLAPYVSAAGVADFSGAEITQVQATQTEVPVSGVEQTPKANAVYDQTGRAVVFDQDLDGEVTANGELLDLNAMIAAHPTLPLPSLVQVINLENNSEMVVRVNDRGPFDGGGLIELSTRAADVIGLRAGQSANVRVRYLGPAPVAQSAAPQPAPPEPARPQPDARPALQTPPRPVQPELAGGPAIAVVPQNALYPAPSDTATGADYYVQLGSFSNIANAQNLNAKIAGAASVQIVPVRVNGADFFRVMAGPVGSAQDANLLRAYLANQGIADGIVINPR